MKNLFGLRKSAKNRNFSADGNTAQQTMEPECAAKREKNCEIVLPLPEGDGRGEEVLPNSSASREVAMTRASSSSAGSELRLRDTRKWTFTGNAPRAFRFSQRSGFTMIEIAISLAIIGFALVAIIGILPLGMNVQKDNRHETIINQDASVLMNAIKNGERGLDDLTNYVLAITNYVRVWNARNGGYAPGPQTEYGYTRLVSTEGVPARPTTPQFPLLSGSRIVGLLTTPKVIPVQNGFLSNHVVAFIRSMSGPASEKFPQNDPTIQSFALNYRVIAEVLGVNTNTWFDASWTNYGVPNLPPAEVVGRSNYMRMVQTFQNNLHDLRLTYRWPLAPNGKVGDNRQIYRTMVSGMLIRTNEPNFVAPHCILYYFEPRTYFKGT